MEGKLSLWRRVQAERMNAKADARALEISTPMAKKTSDLEKQNEALKEQTITDPLTGLINRRELNRHLEELKEKWKPKSPGLGGKRSADTTRLVGHTDRKQDDFVIIMIDLDHFKDINDAPGLGHAAGDAVLHQVGKLLLSGKVLRAHDIPARYGGEEIVVVCPGTRLDEGEIVAKKIREGIANLKPLYNDNAINITASLGVSSAATTLDIDEILKKADVAMYQAKADGRNRVNKAIPTRHDPHAETLPTGRL
ncbi:MAG: GGDEF domain-containing protein [bacterium]|nr:GGDEF domain-containing protein [bacterium]